MFSLQNKTAIITGPASGIGRAIALQFAKQHAKVHLVDLHQEALNVVAAEIMQANGNAHTHACDVSNQLQVKEVIEGITQVDVLVNSACVSNIGKATTTSEADFDRVFNVNVRGV